MSVPSDAESNSNMQKQNGKEAVNRPLTGYPKMTATQNLWPPSRGPGWYQSCSGRHLHKQPYKHICSAIYYFMYVFADLRKKKQMKPFHWILICVFFFCDIKSVHFCGLLKMLWAPWAACPPLAEPFLLPWPHEQCIRLRRHCFLGVLTQRAQCRSWRAWELPSCMDAFFVFTTHSTLLSTSGLTCSHPDVSFFVGSGPSLGMSHALYALWDKHLFSQACTQLLIICSGVTTFMEAIPFFF